MRRITANLAAIALLLAACTAFADQAILVDAKVLVEKSPEPVATDDTSGTEGNPLPSYTPPGNSTNATYVSTGGYAVSSPEYIDMATVVFDMGATTSVTSATLTMPIAEKFPLGGKVPLQVFAFSDNGVIEYTDYSVGFPAAIASLELATASAVVVDVTGITNAMLKSGRYVGFKAKSALVPEDIPTETFPKYKGVRFGSAYTLEFTPGAAPVPPTSVSNFNGLNLVAQEINVPSFGVVNAQLQVQSVNDGILTLTVADIVSGGVEIPPDRTGLELLDCAAFTAPTPSAPVVSGQATYSITSGLLSIPSLLYYGKAYAAELQFISGTNPMQFGLLSLEPVVTTTTVTSPTPTVASLGGSVVIEPTQDFIPLCHGWVLIGDTTRNRLVERNVITGQTAGVYQFGTKPNQLMLDEASGIVYMSVHPESERLYKMTYATGKVTWNRIIEGVRQYSVRDMALGELGNVLAILYDADQLEPADPMAPVAESGLWLGYLTTDAALVIPSIPLADPIRIEYDPVFKRVFLTTQSNLATFFFNPFTFELTFVEGTDISVGSGCTDFSISPDGTRLAYPCPAGNIEDDVTEPHVGIHDLDPIDYKNPDGEWYLGSTPVSSVFSPDGTLLIATDGTKIFFFDVVTHLLLDDYEMGLVEDEVVRKIRLSKDGDYLLILISNALGASSGKMYWMPLPNIVGTPL